MTVRLLPSAQAILRVDATPAVVAARLDELITSRRPIVFAPTAPFVGWVRDSRFEIKRARSWLGGQGVDPLLRGTIVGAGFGSELRLSVQLGCYAAAVVSAYHALVIFMVGLACGVSFGAVPNLLIGAAGGVAFIAVGAFLLYLARHQMAWHLRANSEWALQRLREGLSATADAEGPEYDEAYAGLAGPARR